MATTAVAETAGRRPAERCRTGPAGEEIFCDEHGRVRVKSTGTAITRQTRTVRAGSVWHGVGRHRFWPPGDTTCGSGSHVDFLNGDPDQPIIMGRTYHRKTAPPAACREQRRR